MPLIGLVPKMGGKSLKIVGANQDLLIAVRTEGHYSGQLCNLY